MQINFKNESGKKSSPRTSRVASLIQGALAEIFARGSFHSPEMPNLSITVSAVNVSPDLRNATVYLTPLVGGDDKEMFMHFIHEITPQLRYEVTKKVHLKYSPQLYFKLDNSFDVAHAINTVLDKLPKGD